MKSKDIRETLNFWRSLMIHYNILWIKWWMKMSNLSKPLVSMKGQVFKWKICFNQEKCKELKLRTIFKDSKPSSKKRDKDLIRLKMTIKEKLIIFKLSLGTFNLNLGKIMNSLEVLKEETKGPTLVVLILNITRTIRLNLLNKETLTSSFPQEKRRNQKFHGSLKRMKWINHIHKIPFNSNNSELIINLKKILNSQTEEKL